MKKFSWLCFCLIIVLSMSAMLACGKDTDDDIETAEQMKTMVETAMDAVNLSVNVTDNLELPTTSGTVAISWDSDKKAVISNTGEVVRPAFGSDDVEVKLTGSFSYKDYSDTKVYTLRVKAIREKVYTFAGGYKDDNAIFTAPNDGSYGSVVDKGDGIISLRPTEDEGRKNGPYFKMSEAMPTLRENGFTIEAMIYLDHETMKTGGNTFIMDCSVNGKDKNWIGGVFVVFSANDTNVVITHSQFDDTNMFAAMTGWYTVGMKFFENNGKLNAKTFIKDAAGMELHSWDNTQFKGFTITDTTGELEDVKIDLIEGPRSLWFTDMNINNVDIKKISLSYNEA